MMASYRVGLSLTVALFALLAGCASDRESTRGHSETASRATDVATSMVGKPYRYGGHHPNKGFDCSGLVYFSYQRAGMDVPRSTSGQRRQARKISPSSLSRGDLLFFNQEGKRSSHVGIYLGDDRFVHAPSSGKRVRIDSFQSRYWQKHFVDARRFF